MNTSEIRQTLRYLPLSTAGVYAADEIPRVWSKPAGIIVNTDEHTRSGEHWVAMYVDRHGRGWYFDSYGLPPIIPQHINGIRRNCKFFRHNLKQLQSNTSDVCGQFCIVFLHFMSCGLGMARFHKLFGDDTRRNDKIVRDYYNAFIARRTVDNNINNVKFTGGAFAERRYLCKQACCVRR